MKRINEKTLESLEIKMHGLSKKKKKRHSDVQEFNFQKKKCWLVLRRHLVILRNNKNYGDREKWASM